MARFNKINGDLQNNLEKQTATSINGITFKLFKTEHGEYKVESLSVYSGNEHHNPTT